MLGYLGKPDLTARSIIGGWYTSPGDMAKIDPDGYLILTGGCRGFAKIAGEMVPLEKIEEELHGILATERTSLCRHLRAGCKRAAGVWWSSTSRPSWSQYGLEVRPWWQKLGGRGLPNLWVPDVRDFHPVAGVAGAGQRQGEPARGQGTRAGATRR